MEGKKQIFDFPHIHFDRIDSTNRYLMDNLSNISPLHEFVALADFQSDGRGQYGRNWQSNACQNILMSIILDTSFLKIDQIFGLHLISALACREVIADLVTDVRIKWPNDIFIKNKKVAGILIENSWKNHELLWSVIGIGINVNQADFNEMDTAGSISQFAESSIDRFELTLNLRKAVLKYYDQLKEGDFIQLLDQYNGALYQKGTEAQFMDKEGLLMAFVIEHVDPDGRLVVSSDQLVMSMQHGSFQWIID